MNTKEFQALPLPLRLIVAALIALGAFNVLYWATSVGLL